jgi:hypothetical protein
MWSCSFALILYYWKRYIMFASQSVRLRYLFLQQKVPCLKTLVITFIFSLF